MDVITVTFITINIVNIVVNTIIIVVVINIIITIVIIVITFTVIIITITTTIIIRTVITAKANLSDISALISFFSTREHTLAFTDGVGGAFISILSLRRRLHPTGWPE
jgi:hypothetical protein